MTEQPSDSEVSNPSVVSENLKTTRSKPFKVLPTERVGFEKQLSVLRGFAAASGPEHKSVSNREVGQIVQMHENTVSTCNPFFADIGFLSKEGMKQRPSEEVFSYASSYEWDIEKAAHKLAPLLRKTWFAASLIPKLAFRTLTEDEAVTFLADEAKASKDYKANLELLLGYLRVAGVVQFDGASYTLGPNAREGSERLMPSFPPNVTIETKSTSAATDFDEIKFERFTIPIPGKESATITVPKDLTAEDWDMLTIMLGAYIKRLQAQQATK